MLIKRIVSYLLALALLPALMLTGCSQTGDNNAKKVELVYVEWASEVASTNVVRVVLEDLGYKVNIVPVSAAAMWQSVASGDADGMVAAWLPTTHGHYLAKVKDQVKDLGPNLTGTRIGLVVPDYVSIDSIDQLNDDVQKFDHKIIGIDPGAGIMSKTETAIDRYKLDYKLVEGSGATMTAALGDAIKRHQWIVVTGWTPHWMFSRWKLKYLDDPLGVYGKEESIHTIVRKGLKKDKPEVYRVLDAFHWTPADMSELMDQNAEPHSDPYKNAQAWVKQHPQIVSQWTGQK